MRSYLLINDPKSVAISVLTKVIIYCHYYVRKKKALNGILDVFLMAPTLNEEEEKESLEQFKFIEKAIFQVFLQCMLTVEAVLFIITPCPFHKLLPTQLQ